MSSLATIVTEQLSFVCNNMGNRMTPKQNSKWQHTGNSKPGLLTTVEVGSWFQ